MNKHVTTESWTRVIAHCICQFCLALLRHISHKDVLFIKSFFPHLSPCCLIIWCNDVCTFCFLFVHLCQMLFNRFSDVVFLLVIIALNGSSASESGGVKKKVFNGLKPLLSVQREQQIGLSYKTLIDLWKVELPALNCAPALSPYETVIIKKKNGFLHSQNHWMTQNQS